MNDEDKLLTPPFKVYDDVNVADQTGLHICSCDNTKVAEAIAAALNAIVRIANRMKK